MATRDSEVNVVIKGTDQLTPELKKIESSIIRAVGAISAALAGIKIGTAPIIAAAEFERELANVAKTTDFTVSQMNRLSDSLLEISKRVDVSAVDLAKIAAAAGQQGLGKQGVAGVVQFTDSVSRMASVLDITAEEAAVNVGKIINVFKIPLAEVEKAVSVFNEVSNNSTANGKELLDVVKRIGDAAGALNLQQTTALAATGLDFGISPEVVGTAISRVFSAAFEKADQFGELMKISATEWIQTLQRDGLGAFQQFLAQLRTLDAQSQQKAIVKLVGGGRIGALLNKLVQDTTDSVLTKNFKAAEDGLSGLSAIKEQAKVLDTLDAKAIILANSFRKLGIDSAQSLLEPLKQYADELSDALESPGVKSFVDAAVKSLGELLKLIADAVKWVASLNINWENFLKVLQLFIGLKVGNMILSMIGGMKLFGVELKTVGAAATQATAAVNGLAAAEKKLGKWGDAEGFKASLAARVLGYEELSIKHKQRLANIEAERKAEQRVMDTARALDKATPIAKAAAQNSEQDKRAASVAIQQTEEAKRAVAAQQAAVAAVEKKAQDAREAEQARFNARLAANEEANKKRILASEQKHAANIASIQRAANKVRQEEAAAAAAAQNATNVRATPGFLRDKLAVPVADEGVAQANARVEAAKKALAAEQAATIAAYNKAQADQARFHAAAIANITKFHTQRIAALEAAGSKEVAAEKAALAQRLAAYNAYVVAQGEAQKKAAISSANATAAGLAAANAAVQAQAAKTAAGIGTSATGIAASFQRMAAAIQTALGGIGLALRTLAGVAAAAGRILVGAFFWVTLIYSIADMTGALEKLGPMLQRVTDWLGLTSKAQREQQIKNDQATESWKRQQEELDNFTAAYTRALDATGQQIDPAKITQQVEIFRLTDDPQKKKDALAEILAVIDGARAKQVALQENTTENLQRQTAEQIKILEKASADRLRITAQLAAAEAELSNAAPGSGKAKNAQQKIEINVTGLDAANKAIADAEAKLNLYRQGLAGTTEQINALAKDQQTAFQAAGGLFTTSMVDPLEQIVIPLVRAREEAATLTKALLEDIPRGAREAGVSAETAGAPIQAQIIKNNQLVAGLTKAIESYSVAVKAKPGVTAQEIAAAQLLVELAQQRLTAVMAVTEQVKAQPKLATGADLGKPRPNPFGSGAFSGKDAAAEARKLAKAQLELARTRIQAENALADERAKQELKREEEKYDLGLKALKDYFDARERIQLEANARDIQDKGLEILEVNRALKDPSIDKATRVGFEATKARLQGQIAVLIQQREGISEEIKRDRYAGEIAFSERVSEETLAVFRSGVVPAEAQKVFNESLRLMETRYSAFTEQLRSEGKGALADALIAGFSIDAFVASIDQAAREISLIFGNLQLEQESLNIARENGAVTSLEASKEYSDSLKRQIPLMEDQLRVMEQQLDVLAQTVGSGSLAYREQAQAIDDLILRIQRLGQETDKTARELNAGFTDSLESALNNLEPTFESLKENILGFLRDITNQVKAVFAKQIAESISQALGNVGTGGFGGFFQKLIDDILAKQAATKAAELGELGINTDLVAQGTKVASRATTEATVTTTAAQTAALTTTTAAQTAATTLIAGATQAAAALSGAAAANGVTGLGELGINTALETATPVATAATDTAAAAAASAALTAVGIAGDLAAPALATMVVPTEAVSLGLSALPAPLLEVFTGLVSIAGVAVQAAIAIEAMSAAAAANAASSVVTGAFHSGGVVGRRAPQHRVVNPAVFTNAVRYHNGGVAGLAPNEVPAILEKGEVVLTAQQAAAQKSADNAGQLAIRNILVTDPNFVPDAMATSQGERVMTTFIQRNKASIRQMLGT